MPEVAPMHEPEDPIAEAKRLLEGVEACFGTLDYRADEQDGAGLYSVVMVESKPRAYALCYATTEESAALIAAAPRLLAALCERLAAAELRASKFGGLVDALRDVRGYAAAFRDAPNHIIERATDILDWASEAAE